MSNRSLEVSLASALQSERTVSRTPRTDNVALFQTLVQLGGAFGLAITTVISDAYDKKSLAAGVDRLNSELNGLHAAFWLGAGTSFVAVAVAVIMLRGMGAIGKQPKSLPAVPADKASTEESEKELEGENVQDMPRGGGDDKV